MPLHQVATEFELFSAIHYSVGVNVTFEPVFYNVSEGRREVVLRVVKRGESVVSVNVTFSTMDNSALGVICELRYSEAQLFLR